MGALVTATVWHLGRRGSTAASVPLGGRAPAVDIPSPVDYEKRRWDDPTAAGYDHLGALYHDPRGINLHRTMARKYGLESVTDEQLVDFALFQYRGYMEGFLRDRPRIHPGNLIEIRYEEFVADRMHWLRTIYDTLALGAFAPRVGPLEAYISTIEHYEPHRFADDPTLKRRIDVELGFAVAALGYEQGAASAQPC